MYEAQPPRDWTIRGVQQPYQLDAPPYDPQNAPVPLRPVPPNFRDERWLRDNAPIRPPATPPIPPPNLAGLSPLQVGSVTGQSNTNAALAAVLARIFGQG